MKVFFQNGPSRSPHVLCGQGHVTAVRLSDGVVSDIHVPPSRTGVSLANIFNRKWWPILWGLLTSSHRSMHSGTSNTAVVHHNGRVLAIEESSKPFELDVREGIIRGGHWLEDERVRGVHSVGSHDCYSYLPFRRVRPLVFNGEEVDWEPTRLPLMVHSYASAGPWIVFPVMSTSYGHLFPCVAGKKALPLSRSPFEWLVVDRITLTASVVPTHSYSDVFHVVATTLSDDGATMAVFASHVDCLETFLETGKFDGLHFSFRKTVIDVPSMTVRHVRSFEDASGDFPSVVEGKVVLINRMVLREVVFFDIEEERVVHTVGLRHDARDVVYEEGHLLYCTTDMFVKCDLDGNVVFQTSIPERYENFHCCVLDVV